MRPRLWPVSMTLLLAEALAQDGGPVPVLCYHGFSDDSSSGTAKLTEQYSRFDAMLRHLLREGFSSVFPEELDSRGAGPEKAVILTFDDGRKEQMQAASMMFELGIKGIFFVIPARISDESREYMSCSDLELLRRWGHQIGVHGFSHKSMIESPEESKDVAALALKAVKDAVPTQTEFPSFAYPFGHYDSSAIESVSQQFRFLHTVNPGYWDGESRLIPRMLVTVDRPAEFFRDYVTAGSQFSPSLISRTPDGGSADTVAFLMKSRIDPGEITIMAVSADRDGYHYSTFPAAGYMTIDASILTLDLHGFIRGHYRPDRMVLSYALLKTGGTAYLSSGMTHWLQRNER